MLKKTKKRLLTTVVLAALLSSNGIVLGADAKTFRTPEYETMGALDYIHAADAYAKGYSGKGVMLGIIDTALRKEQEEFAGKKIKSNYTYGNEIVWSDVYHGTSVASLMTANKNDKGIHGVAYSADLLTSNALATGDNEALCQSFDYVAADADTKVVNCSFGERGIYLEYQTLADYGNEAGSQYFNNYYTEGMVQEGGFAEDTGRYCYLNNFVNCLSGDKLAVISAGNYGYLSTSYPNSFAFYYPSIRNKTLSVISCNLPDYTGVGGTNGASDFSNLAMFGEDYSLAAPGMQITGTSSDTTKADSVFSASGTSSSAPLVTGTLGLVQEAYPYLAAKQLGDVALSTTSQIEVNKNEAAFTLRTLHSQDGTTDTNDGVNIYCYDNRARPTTDAEWKSLLAEALHVSERLLFVYGEGYGFMDSSGQLLMDKIYFYNNMPITVMFGQGLVNADKATNGVGALNAKRLGGEDLDTVYTKDSNGQALYKVNTRGYNSKWSNDIGETRVLLPGAGADEDNDLAARQAFYRQYGEEAARHSLLTDKASDIEDYITKYNEELAQNPLRNLPVGLYKEGEGILRLTGNNSYQGASVAAAGTLQIDGTVAGDAYSTGGGILTGVGNIKGNVYNDNIVMPGSYAVNSLHDTNPQFSIGTLHIAGNLAGSGTLVIAVNDTENSKLEVGGSADLSHLSVVPSSGVLPIPGKTYEYLEAGSIKGNVLPNKISSFITLTGTVTGSNASFTAENKGLDSVSDLTVSQRSLLKGLDKMAMNAITTDQTSVLSATLFPLYYTEEGVIRDTGAALAAEERANLLQPGPLGDLNVAAVDGRLNAFSWNEDENMPDGSKLPIILDEDNHVWLQFFKGREGNSYSGSLDYKTQGGVVGYDFSPEADAKVGSFFSYGKTSYEGSYIKGDSHAGSLGLYGSRKDGDWDYRGLVSYGQNNYNLDHSLAFLGEKLNADFQTKVWEGVFQARYTLPANKDTKWQIMPYGKVGYTHTGQDAYEENGTGCFREALASAANSSWRAETGIEFKYNGDGNSVLLGHLGYKRILAGARSELRGSFMADPTAEFTLESDSPQNYLTYGLSISGSLGGDWTGQLGISGEYASHSHSEIIGAMAKYNF